MFSTLTEAARKSAAAAGGFASRVKGESSAFSHDGAGGSKSTKTNKPAPRNGNLTQNDGNGGKQKWKGGRRDPNDAKRSRRRRDPRASPSQDMNDASQRPQSHRSFDGSPSSEPVTQPESNDPLAISIYETLNAHDICPPQWPSEPGDVKSQQAMSRFRDRYEAYRQKARVALIQAGLIDDPEKRKRLNEALDFKGICEDMCPEFEKITRITEHDVNRPERDQRTGLARVRLMVKKLARSAAGQEAPLPMDVRSAPALRRTLDYLIDVLLCRDKNLLTLHPFLWDRTRAIRRDFAFFSSMTEEEIKTQAYVLENITRFHVTSLHLLSRREKEDERFVEQQELEQLGKTLLSLRDIYDDCNQRGIECDNEAEFRAYYLLFHGHDPSMLEALQRQWNPRLWKDSDDVRTAVSLVEALKDTQEFIGSRKDGDAGPLVAASGAHLSYFRIVEDVKVSYTMACFAECHFPYLRRSILAAVKRALARPKDAVEDVTAAALNQFLRFDKVEQAIKFAQSHNLEFVPDEQDPADLGRQFLVLNDKFPLPHVRLNHQFSQSLVERKRGFRPLPDLIHTTVFENTDGSQDARNGIHNEESMFVVDDEDFDEDGLDSSSPEAASAELEDPTKEPVPAGATSSSPNGPPKASRANQAFLMESDTDDDGPGDFSAHQQQQPTSNANPFAPGFKAPSRFPPADAVAPPPPPARLPTFQEVKALDSKNFLYDVPNPAFGQPVNGGASSGGSQPAKPGFFASGLQPPGLLSGNKSVNVTTEKPTPFAPSTGLSFGGTGQTQGNTGNSAPATTNPFATSIQSSRGPAVSGNTQLGTSILANPSPFNPFSQPVNGPAPLGGSPPHNFGQPVSNSSASLSTPVSGAAIPTAKNPLSAFGTLGGSKAAEPLTTAHPAAETASNEQIAPPKSTSLLANTGGSRDKGPLPNIPATSSSTTTAFGPSAPSSVLGSAKQTEIGQARDTTGASLAVQSSAAPESIALSDKTLASAGSKPTSPTTTPASKPLSEAVQEPVGPPRDLLGDFNTWYVQGDNGLLSDFLVESIRSITERTFKQFEEEVEEQKRREEEERTNAEVDKFRVYNLSLKFFYRWKRNARAKRLREVRRKARDEMRAYYAERHTAERKAQREIAETAKETCRLPDEPAASNNTEEFINMVKANRKTKREARESLLASGVLSGMEHEQEAAKMIVGDETRSSKSSENGGTQSLESSPVPAKKRGPKTRALREVYLGRPTADSTPACLKKEGPKTRALRQMYFGQPERFRRSLPSMSSMNGDMPESAKRPSSNASSRWRLKAMGIVQLPDGTAVPESLANEMSSGLQYPRSVSPWRSRRLSATDALDSEIRRPTPPPRQELSTSPVNGTTPDNKRKRLVDDGEGPVGSGSTEKKPKKRIMNESERLRMAALVDASPSNKRRRSAANGEEAVEKGNEEEESPHKRIMSDAENLRLELRALRAELEEGTEWFRAQNERFRSESEARTPWYDESI